MTTVTVRPGDSLWAIAQENRTSVAAIQAANPQLKNPNQLRIGQTLSLPQDSFEHRETSSSMTRSEFVQKFSGSRVELRQLGQEPKVSQRVVDALSRSDHNRDGKLSGVRELHSAFGILDSFDRDGNRESIALRRGGKTLALGHVTRALSQAVPTMSQQAISEREAPSLNAVTGGAVLKLGDSGQSVEMIQSRLGQLGFEVNPSGQYDEATVSVIKAFQRQSTIQPTGRFGSTTFQALRALELAPRPGFDALKALVSAGSELGVGDTGAAVVDLQRLLNRGGARLSEDGVFGPVTAKTLKIFQDSQSLASTGRAGKTTLKALLETPRRGGVTGAQLKEIVPQVGEARADALSTYLSLAMSEADITTPNRRAMFIAQLAHESGGFRYNEEIASGQAYEWRRDLGNIYAGDGRRYKGRGFIQLTGRANYREAGRALGLNLEQNPSLASSDLHAARVAAWYWESRDINTPADEGNFLEVTRRINGGTNGYWDRLLYYNRAKEVLV